MNASFDQFITAAQTAVGNTGTLHFVQEGEKIIIDGVEFEVLLVPDVKRVIAMGNDSRRFPGKNNWANDTSIVTRCTIGGKTVMFMGDCGQNEGVLLLEKYGDALKSDFCQMAHHGQDAVDKPVYAAIRPDVCLYMSCGYGASLCRIIKILLVDYMFF
jgi:beta-lactamase superfamily II metal-dependent hydrolase